MQTLVRKKGQSPDSHVVEHALRIAKRTAMGVLADREAAADVAQEVAVIALRRHGELRDPAAIDGWLHRTAVRAATEGNRSRGRPSRFGCSTAQPGVASRASCAAGR